VILPGSVAAGVAHYVDDQLSVAPAECMLTVKYLRQRPPYISFYRGGLRAAESAVNRLFACRTSEWTSAQATQFIGEMATDAIPGGMIPAAPLLYFALRSDAVDVVYGTQAGFQRLGVPYMAHIVPPSPWGSS
jgi:hypothetical protein